MANFGCRVWSNTGFNSINIPDSPALLNAIPYADFPTLDLNQERFLGSVRIKANWDSVKNADYCRVGNFYYTIENINMTSPDVAVLTLTPDYITSAGGVSGLNILDGTTQRVHVSDDTYGAYGESDPLTAPSRPLELETSTVVTEDNGLNYHSVVESSLDLYKMGKKYDPDTGIYDGGATVAYSTTSEEGGEGEEGDYAHVTYPAVFQNEYGTSFALRTGSGTEIPLPAQQYVESGSDEYGVTQKNMNKRNTVVVFDSENKYVRRGIEVARALGVEGAISAQYSIPINSLGLTPAAGDGGHTIRYNKITGEANNFSSQVNLPFEYGTAKNKRVFYGSYTPYGIISGNGSKGEFLAERIYDGGTSPSFYGVSDPRIHGRLYYRFGTLDKKTSASGLSVDRDFFRDCVPGNNWQSIPIIYAGKSGSMIETSMFNIMMGEQEAQAGYIFARGKVANTMNKIGLGAQMAASMITGLESGYNAMASGSGLGSSLKSIGSGYNAQMEAFGGNSTFLSNMINAGFSEADFDEMRRRQMMAMGMEQLAFGLSQDIYMPTINFPDAEQSLYSAISGEGCIVYRYKYANEDISRIDKLLTMYGYKHTKAVEASDFTNRTYFNFIQAGVSVGGNLPRWWADGIAVQLSGGVRIWHVKPNNSYYTNNPIR